MSVIEVRIPDIGDFQDVEIIEILVKPGDLVEAETSMITLESDKATIDIPACLLYTSPSPRDATLSRMPSSA